MAYDYIPQMIFGVILLVVGIKLNMEANIATLVRIALILIGVVILGYGLFGLFGHL